MDEGTNVSVAYKERDNRFTGKIEKVVIEVGASNSGAAQTPQSLDLDEAAAEAEE